MQLSSAHITAPAPTFARALLKDATAALHEEVDRCFGHMLGQGEPGYRRFLLASLHALEPLETALTEGGATALLPDWPRRVRAADLRADLAALGVDAGPTTPATLPDGEAYRFGVMYVLEGSRLGARLLARRLLAAADARLHAASRYLCHGHDRPFWPSFLTQLERSQAVAAAPAEAADGARAAFARFLEAAAVVERGERACDGR